MIMIKEFGTAQLDSWVTAFTQSNEFKILQNNFSPQIYVITYLNVHHKH